MSERMSDERVDREIRGFLAWHAEAVTGAPSADEVAARISDRAGTATMRLRVAPRLAWVLLAGLLIIALLGALATGASRPPAPPLAVTNDATPSAVPEATLSQPASAAPTPLAAASLPALRRPGTTASPAGVYGWEGGPRPPGGFAVGMHRFIGEREVAALLFRVGSDCLKATPEQQTPVRVAGFDGVFVEPYEPPVSFGAPGGPSGIETTRAYALAVGDRTLCAYVTWNQTTTDDEVAAAVRVLDTLRAVPVGDDRIRIVFTLDDGWDTG